MALLLAASLSPAAAKTTTADPVEEACVAHGGGVTSALHTCFAASAKRADARLNTAYHRATAGLSPAVRTRLVAAQRAWLQFRDLDCAVIVAREAGGSDAALAADQCITRRTITRAGDLDDLASGN